MALTPTLTPDDLYWETDDINPNHIIYDLDNNEIIIPSEEEEITTTPTPTEQPIIKKIVSRNVGNTRRRRIR